MGEESKDRKRIHWSNIEFHDELNGSSLRAEGVLRPPPPITSIFFKKFYSSESEGEKITHMVIKANDFGDFCFQVTFFKLFKVGFCWFFFKFFFFVFVWFCFNVSF